MKTTVKLLIVIGILGTFISCKSTFNANETLQKEENRTAIYQEIISNPVQFTKLISEARKDEEAKMILMKSHMEQMESGNMKMMMQKNPEMKEKMQSQMQKMMDKMQEKMLNKMMQSEKGRKILMEKIHGNEQMKKEMKKRMSQMMDENPEMMKEMMQKMMEKNPEMMQKMKDKMKSKGE